MKKDPLVSKLSNEALKSGLDHYIGMRDELEPDTAAYKTNEGILEIYATEYDKRNPPQPLTQPGWHLKGGSSSANTGGRREFNSFGEQMVAVMRAGMPGGRVDQRLYNATGLGETIPADGGFLVQDDFSNELLNDIMATGQVASRCRKITISSNSNSIKINGVDETSRATGSRQGGIRGYWAAEAAEKTASQPTFRQINLELKKLVGLCYATDELMEDANALGDYLQQGFTSEMAFLLDDAIVNGVGAGMPLGIMNAGCKVTAAAVSGQGANTFVAQNALDMFARALGKQENLTWLVNRDVLPALYNMTLGSGNELVFTPPGGISGKPYSTLLGAPVIVCEQCATLGSESDVILANLPEGYIIAEKGGIKMDASISVRFVYDEMAFRWVLRVDGQPVRASALTPYKGSNTQSHFITLNSTRT